MTGCNDQRGVAEESLLHDHHNGIFVVTRVSIQATLLSLLDMTEH